MSDLCPWRLGQGLLKEWGGAREWGGTGDRPTLRRAGPGHTLSRLEGKMGRMGLRGAVSLKQQGAPAAPF